MNETITAKQAAIQSYVNAGYILFPCGNIKNEKAPRNEGWQDTEFDADPDLPDIFGVNLQDDDFLLDFDPIRGDTELVQLLNRFCYDQLPLQTFMVNSGGANAANMPGLHVYFKMPSTDAKFHARVPGFPAIEIKVKGRLVVGCGSVTKKGKIYSPYRLSPSVVLQAPQELVDLCKVQPKVQNTDKSIETDDKGTQARFISYLMMPHQVHGSCYEMACEGKALGLSRDKIKELILDYMNPRWGDPISPELLQTKINSAFDHGQTVQGALSAQSDFASAPAKNPSAVAAGLHWDRKFDKEKQAEILLPTMANGVNLFKLESVVNHLNALVDNPIHKLIRFNKFTNQIEFTRKAPWHEDGDDDVWKDKDTVLLKNHIANWHAVEIGVQTLSEVILIIASSNSYHPVREWLLSLVWDKVPRLNMLLPNYCNTVNTPYARAIGKNTLIAACARVFNPGCQHDSMLILEGEQGTMKTKFIAALGGKWYGDTSLDPGNKDTIGIIQRGWIFEISELEGVTRSQVQALKRFLTCKTDMVRMPYDRFTSDYKRHCIFIGTTNPDPGGYLNDTTGNRRFWPIWTNKIELDKVIKDRDQLFAEALYRYQKGESFYLDTADLIQAAKEETKRRTISEPWEEIIEDWLSKVDLELDLTYQRIAEQALNLPGHKMNRYETARIRRSLKELGFKWVQKYSKTRKAAIWMWVKPNNLEDLW